MSAAAAAALATADALDPGHGIVEAGIRLDAGSGPRAFADAAQKFSNGLELYGEADMAGLSDYSASAGLRYRW